MLCQPKVSVIIPTFNRSKQLGRAIRSVLRQDTVDVPYELIVVDNNSTDDTKELVYAVSACHEHIHYVFERRQGNSYARNAGIQNVRSEILAFLDDDIVVTQNWLRVLITTFSHHPDLAFIGGRVLPIWEREPPGWLTQQHWAPLALLDHGPDELSIAGDAPLGLLTANIAFRRNLFDEIGLFSPALQRVRNGIGSMEDHELLLRACRHGKKGLYVPALTVRAPVENERLTKAYHQRWHTGHGRFYAIMRDPEWERSSVRFLNIPGHLYRHAASEAIAWLKNIAMNQRAEAFVHGRHLRFFWGFSRQRLMDAISQSGHERPPIRS